MSSSLKELLTKDMIRLQAEAPDCESALRMGGQILVDSGGVEPIYLDAMIEMLHEFGPYVVIAPGFALGHARPDAGVKRTCFSLLTLSKPVEFGVEDNDPVDIIFSFAAPDKSAHIEALRQLARMCSQEGNLDRIRTARTADDIFALL
ncbi:MAG: PTS sugar transporter subunit IIA [Chloroflexi bacterium]|nr:MAG: PTS sugar transporter subunit IIA [Chloroflexota bacterium]